MPAKLEKATPEASTPAKPKKLNRAGAADYVGLSKATLESWASLGKGPRFFKAGSRVWYLVSELDRWIEERSTNCSSALS